MAVDDRTVVLPGGVARGDGQVCRRVRVRQLTGADEEALFERGSSGSERVSAFLARAIDTIEDLDAQVNETLVDNMYLGDRDYLLLRLRQLELGDAVHQVTRCPSCARKVDVDLSIGELPVRHLAMPQPAYRIRLEADGGTDAVVRLPNGSDATAVEALALENPAAANTRLFARVVLELDGRGPVTEDDARAWSPALRAELAEWLDASSPGPDLFLDLACPHCHADMSYSFDLAGFFLPNTQADPIA